LIDVVNIRTVGDNSNAILLISTDIEFARTSLARQIRVVDRRGKIFLAVLNLRQALHAISSQDESIVADLAAVLGSMVNHTVIYRQKALVALAGQTREVVLAADTETHAVVLPTVGDGSRNAAAPISGLSEATGAVGADVGVGNVQVAVIDFLQAAVLDKNKAIRARLTDSGRSVLRVRETSGDVSNQRTDRSVLQVVPLFTPNASTEIVDGLAKILSGLNAAASRKVIEVLGVALGAVEVVHVGEATGGVGGLGVEHG
jgi:hypothetical protein